MRKVILQNMVTLDGFLAGANDEIDWHVVDQEFNEYAIAFTDTVDALLFGRVTYELMASYWPTAAALADDPIIAAKMNSVQKIVFSRTLDKVEWNNSRLVKENVPQEIAKLKQQPGKDVAIFGSSNLASTLIAHDLIDEYRIMVNPVVLGNGKPLFQDIKKKLELKLVNTRTFGSGVVLLCYQPVK
jgi:dihydrofolate reductase